MKEKAPTEVFYSFNFLENILCIVSQNSPIYFHMSKAKKNIQQLFETFSSNVAEATGSRYAFIGAVSLILIWLITGPLFHYSEVWQLIINTGTTVITFLMVFVIQKAQNKEALSIQLKLNELLATNEIASNRLVCVEELTEEEMKVLQKFYSKLAFMAKKEGNINESHSIEEAEQFHKIKKERTPMDKSNRKNSTTGLN
ncbi:MAG: low affinity iron permease family protein [Chitinophagaceae bacterium]|nr:low affinity iron permease family protein [Chitinophagaceae bacterium]